MSSSGSSPKGPAPSTIRGWRTRALHVVPKGETTSRLTLDFSGPPLTLPKDVVRGAADGAAEGGHDAWAIDHVRRSTPPPMQMTPGWLDQGLGHLQRASKTPTPAGPVGKAPGTAFDLVDNSRPSFSGVDLHAEMADRFALGDFSGALGVAELILGTRTDDPAAQRYRDASREKLEQFYASRLGAMANHVRVAVGENDVRWLGLDHRAGFLLSRIDGLMTLEEIIDTSGMARLEALRTLSELLDQRAIRIESPAARPGR